MIDQSHNIKPKIEAMIQSVVNVQEAYARALLIDRAKLAAAQQAGDVVVAEEVAAGCLPHRRAPACWRRCVRRWAGPDPLAAYQGQRLLPEGVRRARRKGRQRLGLSGSISNVERGSILQALVAMSLRARPARARPGDPGRGQYLGRLR